MNRSQELSTQPEEITGVPRWVQVPVGLVLAALLLLCLAGSVTMVFVPNEKAQILAPALGTGMALVSLWALSVCYRMVLGRRVHGGLLGPVALRVSAWFFLLLPFAGLFTAFFKGNFTHPLQGLLQSAVYVGVFFRLRSLASHRERHDA